MEGNIICVDPCSFLNWESKCYLMNFPWLTDNFWRYFEVTFPPIRAGAPSFLPPSPLSSCVPFGLIEHFLFPGQVLRGSRCVTRQWQEKMGNKNIERTDGKHTVYLACITSGCEWSLAFRFLSIKGMCVSQLSTRELAWCGNFMWSQRFPLIAGFQPTRLNSIYARQCNS